ncbi:SsrA-binding protein [Candidatus Neptunochlamydia vexilliferae]|uniref:SsrA-binding protein n=2 Tax=Candidatus Neptunichlamydia vexilliferae TaxID=1651774 RepID=A0ABS0B0Q0_9BACT|nr:SsrA-binding protein [Candidatus Neptunochlamydia vexilliferae]
MGMSKNSPSELVSNRRARHNYEILETYEAGIALVGTEIKSLRNHGGSLQDAFVIIQKGEAWLKNCSIAPYSFGNIFNHEERRDRKLLLHKKEIEKLKRATDQKGLTIVPLSIYLSKGKAKVKIGVARGKKQHDKRSAIKEREQKRSIERELKG